MTKKFLYPLLIITFSILSACSGSDDNESSPITIEGKWYSISTTVNGEEIPTPHAEGCEYNYMLVGTNSWTSYNFDNITGECIEYIGNENSFNIDGNILTLLNSGNQLEIVQLDNETLLFYSDHQVDVNLDGENDELYMLYSRSPTGGNSNPNVSKLIGKWIIYKAIYEGDTQPTLYDINGECGREVLEFFTDKEVLEMHYLDLDCNNGVGSGWDWWSSGSGFKMGYENSDTSLTITISGNNELLLDGWQDWGYKKYYKKVE